MRKLLRKLRRGFKPACLTATLATCWQAGQVARADTSPPNWGDPVTLSFTGTVSPATTSLSHVFLIYGTGYSSFDSALFSLELGDFTAGQSSPFSVQGSAVYEDSAFWIVAGLYGDLSGGQLMEGVNGVTLGVLTTEGAPWSEFTYPYDEAAAFTGLLNDAPGNIFSYCLHGDSRHNQYMSQLEFTGSSVLWNFSNASNNGQMEITSRIVPEPGSIVLFAIGGMIVAAWRRRSASTCR
jgi:hypothetical protein